ncbi:MAG: hypothetical protein IJP55_01015 [Bacteroidales bacterium]|nr:hypothetical protein [Bacteroidales bacterium]
MDVEFLTRMVGDLILDNDTLGLPGLGSFVVEQMPASFSDKGYTINPPYRRLTLVSKESQDGLLAALYARDNSITIEEAESMLSEFLGELAARLREEKSVELPGLGRLRATRENHFFFVPDEDLDISPDCCGLDAVSLKTHGAFSLSELDLPAVAAPEAAPAAPVQEAATPEQAAGEPITATGDVATEPAANEPAAEARPAAEAKPAKVRRRLPAAARWAIGAACCAALLLGALAAIGRLAPDVADRLLYSKEELEILNYPEDGLGLPR